jgi:hypothetical protein
MEQSMEDDFAARKQPTGVMLLSVLALIGAILMTAVAGWAALAVMRGDHRIVKAGAMMSEMGMPLPIAIASFLFLLVLAWASGIGMGLGRRWGWYCGTFWYAYAIVRNVNALLVIYAMADQMAADAPTESSRGIEYYYFKYGARVVISFAIYLYLFGDNVREYFGIRGSRWKVALEQFGICLGAIVSGSILSLVL